MPLSVGDTAGPYRIVEQLGQGGMATVFKAYHAALDRYVAIKVMHPAFKADASFLARFQREARVVARLDHPNIVPVYDYAEFDGAPYLVMKFIPGETLKARLEHGRLSGTEVLRVIEAVGAALEFAHGQGVLHRDVKPSNILLGSDGSIYLTDFGLARMVQAGESTLSSDSLLGTPSYMSPEQARGDRELDAGTDIYSFGVVVYELVVGRVPFSADTPYAVVHDHIFTPLPAPRQLNPDVPEAAEVVLVKALAKSRADRYGTVAAMVADLKQALGAGTAQTAPHEASAILPVPMMASAPAQTVVASAPWHPEPATAPAPPLEPATELSPTSTGEPAQPQAAPTQSTRGRLQWWQVAVGLVVIVGVCLLAFGVLTRARQRSADSTQTAVAALRGTAAPGTALPSAVSPTTAVPVGTAAPIAGPGQQHILAAEQAFAANQSDAALVELDKAVAVSPLDTAVRLQAGDLALAHKLPEDALQRYYIPAAKLEASTPDARSGAVQSHAALAFYVAAADQPAGSLLDTQTVQYPYPVVAQIAQQRYRVFFGGGQGVPAQLAGFTKDGAEGALAGVVLGDYYLAKSQFLEAAKQYTPVSLLRLANGAVPDWMIREARCDLDAIKTQRANAKVEASCVDLSSLLTGK